MLAAVTVVQFWALAKVQRSMAVAMRMHFFIWVTPACRRFTREGIRYGAQKKKSTKKCSFFFVNVLSSLESGELFLHM